MSAEIIDWAKAPEGYDYYIVDGDGEYPAEFHRIQHDLILGDIYIDPNGLNWIGNDPRLTIYKRPEDASKKPTHLRCVDSKFTDDSFTTGKVYEVKGATQDDCLIVLGDDGLHWNITGDTLEFAGEADVGRFEVVEEPVETPQYLRCISSEDEDDQSFSVGTVYKVITTTDLGNYLVLGDDGRSWVIDGDSLAFFGDPDIGKFEVASSAGHVEAPVKEGPDFGDIVTYKGEKHVFIRIDGDGDYVLRNSKDDMDWCNLGDIEEYAEQNPRDKLRKQILKNIERLHMGPLVDRENCEIEVSVAELIDFIIQYKDTWES